MKEIDPIQKAMDAFMVLTPEQMKEFLYKANFYADLQNGIEEDQKTRRETNKQ